MPFREPVLLPIGFLVYPAVSPLHLSTSLPMSPLHFNFLQEYAKAPARPLKVERKCKKKKRKKEDAGK